MQYKLYITEGIDENYLLPIITITVLFNFSMSLIILKYANFENYNTILHITS